jgi:hypothetical protein
MVISNKILLNNLNQDNYRNKNIESKSNKNILINSLLHKLILIHHLKQLQIKLTP